MKFRMVVLAALVAGSVLFPSIASAKIVSAVATCNSDGWLHVVFTYDDGTTQDWGIRPCGPTIAMGAGFNLVFSDRARISPSGQAFLNTFETDGTISARRVEAPSTRAGLNREERTETVAIRMGDVRPRLAALLTAADPNWKRDDQTLRERLSIFDRWGVMTEARGQARLVPGSMGISVPANDGLPGRHRNAKEICLDRHGFWRQYKGEWGCWFSAK